MNLDIFDFAAVTDFVGGLFNRGRRSVPVMNAQTQIKAQHVMKILDHTGHSMVTWDPEDPASVEAARTKFRQLRSSGYTAFGMRVVEDNGVLVEEQDEHHIIREFDPELGHIMMVPQRQGG